MHTIVSAVAEGRGRDGRVDSNDARPYSTNLVAWLGWHEGWVTLRSIAASLRLRSEGHISDLIKRCEEIFSANPTLLAYHDRAVAALFEQLIVADESVRACSRRAVSCLLLRAIFRLSSRRRLAIR
jgi:hypothetical protein